MTTQKTTTKQQGHGSPAHAQAQAQQAPVPASGDLADMAIAQLQTAVQQAMGAIATIRAALPNPTRLTTEERKHSGGKLKNGEAAVLQTVCDVAADPKYAPMVASLADRDFGTDPSSFEAGLLKERLQRVAVLAPLAQALESLGQDISDTELELGELSAQPARDAYAILKTVAKTDATLSARIKDVIDFYAAIAQAALKTKRAKKAAAVQAMAGSPAAAKA